MDIVTYPIIVEEFHDDGHYYVATSPNIKGMVTQGNTMLELAQNAQDAIAGWINAQHPYPPVQDPSNWHLAAHQQIMWIMVDTWMRGAKQSQRTTRPRQWMTP